jgi:hypothetical protein
MSATERGFRRIFWGLLLVVIDFRLNGFDILPDFIGFALIAAGAGLLVPLNPRFQTAKIMALILIVLSLVSLVELGNDGGPGFNPGWFFFGLIVTVLDVIMVWQLCGGIIDLARERGLDDLATRASTRRGLYIGLHLMSYLVILIALDASPGDMGVFVVGILIFAVVVVCLLMGLMLRAARELGDPWYEEYEEPR